MDGFNIPAEPTQLAAFVRQVVAEALAQLGGNRACPGQGPAENEAGAARAALLWRPREAARALGISQRLLWQLTRDGAVPCVRIGRAVRYSPQALKAWVAGQERRHAGPQG
jgi:excisionase family DNA binding protein